MVLRALQTFANKLAELVLGFTDWIGRQLHISSQWASRAGFIILWGLGMTFIQVDEYALALVLWVLSSVVLLSKAVHWQGISGKVGLTRFLRILYILAAISFMPVSILWTQAKRGEKPWTAFRWSGRSATLRQIVSGCEIAPQKQQSHVTVMAQQASDQQLVNEAILMHSHLVDFMFIDTNAYRQTKKDNTQLCSILQEYEHTITAPLQAIREVMIERLSVEARAQLPNHNDLDLAHPQSIQILMRIAEDLEKLVEAFQKDRHIEGKPTVQWIVPLIDKPVRPLPYTEADTQLSQALSGDGYYAEVRWISAFTPNNIQLLILVKSSTSHREDKAVRLSFNRAMGGLIGERKATTEVGYNYIDFAVDEGTLWSSVEITLLGGPEPQLVSVKGIRKDHSLLSKGDNHKSATSLPISSPHLSTSVPTREIVETKIRRARWNESRIRYAVIARDGQTLTINLQAINPITAPVKLRVTFSNEVTDAEALPKIQNFQTTVGLDYVELSFDGDFGVDTTLSLKVIGKENFSPIKAAWWGVE
jgi:hypothetical protein